LRWWAANGARLRLAHWLGQKRGWRLVLQGREVLSNLFVDGIREACVMSWKKVNEEKPKKTGVYETVTDEGSRLYFAWDDERNAWYTVGDWVTFGEKLPTGHVVFWYDETEEKYVNLVDCPRCGRDHRVKIKKILNPIDQKLTHYGVCPILIEPILFEEKFAKVVVDRSGKAFLEKEKMT
jgi:hypothetical protein